MILQVHHLAKTIGKKSILKDVSFTMNASSVYGITGENGSGKSTLLRIIIGEWKASSGSVTVNGRIGYCPQQLLLFPHLTVEEHFRYFAAAYGLDAHTLAQRSEELMQTFHFKKYQDEFVTNLSGGTQQKLNLSLALLHQPSLLILDEPYSGFDWDTYLRFWDYTQQMREAGCAILIVAHILNEQKRLDTILQLQQGTLTCQ
jgi:ABC-2 type transport system ATP-binding protein